MSTKLLKRLICFLLWVQLKYFYARHNPFWLHLFLHLHLEEFICVSFMVHMCILHFTWWGRGLQAFTAFQCLAVQFPKKLSLLFGAFLSFLVSRGAGLPLASLLLGWKRNPALPFSFIPVFMECTDPGGPAELLPSPGGSWKDLTPWLSHFFPFHLPNPVSFVHLSAFRLRLAEPRSTFPWAWASPPFLLPSHCSIPHTGKHFVSSLLLLVKNEPPAPVTARGTFREQTLEMSLSNTGRQVPNPCPWRSHSLWQATLCSSQEQWALETRASQTSLNKRGF